MHHEIHDERLLALVLLFIRHGDKAVGKKIHFWRFDGWEVRNGRSVIAEVFPPMLRRRYPTEGRTVDQQDTYAFARWLREMDQGVALDRYFDPPLNEDEQRTADLEGWILGVT